MQWTLAAHGQAAAIHLMQSYVSEAENTHAAILMFCCNLVASQKWHNRMTLPIFTDFANLDRTVGIDQGDEQVAGLDLCYTCLTFTAMFSRSA